MCPLLAYLWPERWNMSLKYIFRWYYHLKSKNITPSGEEIVPALTFLINLQSSSPIGCWSLLPPIKSWFVVLSSVCLIRLERSHHFQQTDKPTPPSHLSSVSISIPSSRGSVIPKSNEIKGSQRMGMEMGGNYWINVASSTPGAAG